jgi:hypothetical protein
MQTSSSTRADDIFDNLLMEFGSPTPAAIAAYSARFPALRAQLLEFAAGWAEEEHLPEPPSLSEARVADLVSGAVEGLRAALLGSAGEAGSFCDLLAATGLSAGEVASASGVPGAVLEKLAARRIAPASIGAKLPRVVAAAMNVPSSVLLRVWTSPAPAAALAAFLPGGLMQPRQETLEAALVAAGASPEQVRNLVDA